MVNVEMGAGSHLVLMAVEAIDSGLVGIGDDRSYRGASRLARIDVAGGVVAGGTAPEVEAQDLGKSVDCVAV